MHFVNANVHANTQYEDDKVEEFYDIIEEILE
jgi:hypothetical protein